MDQQYTHLMCLELSAQKLRKLTVAIVDNNLAQTEGLLHLLGHEETAKTHLFFGTKEARRHLHQILSPF